MNRRDALKNLTMSLGYTVAAPTLLSMLNSCTTKAETWIPKFLSEIEKNIITHLVDIILPASDTPGALDVNIPQFIDLMYNDMEKESNQKRLKKGGELFASKFKSTFNTDASEGKREDFETLLGSYFNVSKAEEKEILKQQKLSLNKISTDSLDNYSVYKFLISIRYYTLFGYFTSEEIGENILNYDPIPGSYQGCISINDVPNERAWSLP
ncbi:MAG: gluconate 2-dehydrogenase subunit 3 family protein [Algibacter sp.]